MQNIFDGDCFQGITQPFCTFVRQYRKPTKMKSHILTQILAFSLFIFLFGCEEDNPEPLKNQSLPIVNTQFSDCKNATKSTKEYIQHIELESINGNQLKVTFVNAILNCCPGEIVADAFIQDNVLKVNFIETPPGGLCNCLCPYDLECIIDNIQNRKYEIEVYTGGEIPDAKFSFVYSSNLDVKYVILD